MLASVDAGLLLEVVWVSILAGVTVSVLFSFVVLFGARSAEARRGSNAGAAMVYAGLSVLAFAAFAALVAYGVHIMLSKG